MGTVRNIHTKGTIMNIRSFTTTVLVALAALSACKQAPPKPDHSIHETHYYYSAKKNTVLRVQYTVTDFGTADMHAFAKAQVSHLEALRTRDYALFSPEGRLGIGPQSGHQHRTCMTNIEYSNEGEKMTSFNCGERSQEGFAEVLASLP